MIRRFRSLAFCLAVLGTGHAGMAEELPELTLAALPMAIRDERIAGISVRAVLFAPGTAALAPSAAAALRRLAAAQANDCFLTAQAVGHASPGSEGDEIAAQKLAQARAEAVRTVLAEAGLPRSAVAAVADYGFSLREPRVTLWLFELPRGTDCTGGPRTAKTRAKAAVADLQPDPVPAAAAPVPTLQAPTLQVPAAPAPATTAPAAAPMAAPPAKATARPQLATELRFDSGSSFLPREGERALAELARGLAKDRGYRIRLVAGLDDAPLRPGDPGESARFNRWLAEQRLKRVGDWLEQHVEIRDLALASALEPATRAPSVRVEVLPQAAGRR